MLMNRNPVDVIASSYFIFTSGILGVVHKSLQGNVHKIVCEESICKFVQSCPSFWGAGREG